MTEIAPDEVPDYCDLGDQDPRARRAQAEELMERAQGIEALEDGYRFTFPGDREALEAVVAFALDERRCCPMGRYEIAFRGPDEPVTLSFRGPDPMKEDIREGMELERWFDEVPR